MGDTLKNRVAVITGAGKGLGKTFALALANEGAHLALIGRNAEALNDVATAARKFKVTAEVFTGDVSREEDVRKMEQGIVAKFQKVHILINNAGINIRKNVTDFTFDEWTSVINTNLVGAFLMCRAFVPHMRGEGYGRIINLTSIMSHISLPGRTAYSASKAGLLGFTKALALELAPEGITVNGISPGPCATEMNIPILNNPELNQQFVSKLPVGRWGKVEEIAHLLLYICSPNSGFLTGTDVVIDGGWT
ncbi:MAG: SDR family NAD(P)-dependent oxidoreductase, partial [Limisphaerales bacterium]